MSKIINKHFIDGFVLTMKDYKFNSIFIKNYKLILLILVIPIMLLVLVIYSYNTKIINQQVENNNRNTLIKLKNEIDNITERGKVTAVKLANYKDLLTFYSQGSLYSSFDTIQLIDNIQKQIDYTASTNSDVKDIIIHFRNKDYFIAVGSSWTGFYQINLRNIPAQMVDYENIQDGDSYFEAYGGSMFLKAYIRSFGEIIGVVILKSSNDVFMAKARSMFQTSESRMFILDMDNNIIADSRNIYKNNKLDIVYPQIKSLLASEKLNGFIDLDDAKSIVSVVGSGNMKWRYVLVSPIGIYNQSIRDMKYTVIFLVLLVLFVTLIVSWIITYKLYRPIQIILDVINNKNGNFKKLGESDFKIIDEVGFISSSIKQSQMQNIIIRTELENKMDLLKRAQSVALQAQINPHFLYNTLESINWKALQLLNGQNQISAMVNDLSKLLRLSLDSKSHLVSIDMEIQHAEIYIKIQKHRFKERFLVEWEICDNIKEYKMVKLTLQPLLENALSHGMGKLEKVCIIKIACTESESCIEFIIKDNGCGIDSERLSFIREKLTDSTLAESDHLGLVNVNQRIQLAFGLDYGISLESNEQSGTIVKMTIPKVQ
ncbi:MAG TPA: histidine kinase [Ruminiclostridium sp.]